MVQFIGHTSLNTVLQNCVTHILEDCRELVMGAHNTVIGLVEEEGTRVDVFFHENKASLAIFILSQSILFCFYQELGYVIISEIAENPLDPNCIILVFISVLLQALVIEITNLWNIISSFIDLYNRRLQEVNCGKLVEEDSLGDSSNSCATIECSPHLRHQMLECFDHCSTRITLNLVNRLIAAQYSINSRWLGIPVID